MNRLSYRTARRYQAKWEEWYFKKVYGRLAVEILNLNGRQRNRIIKMIEKQLPSLKDTNNEHDMDNPSGLSD